MTSNTRYTNGKIYKIINNFNDLVYIGSTCLPLRKRIFNHKKEQRAGRSPNRHLFRLSTVSNGSFPTTPITHPLLFLVLSPRSGQRHR